MTIFIPLFLTFKLNIEYFPERLPQLYGKPALKSITWSFQGGPVLWMLVGAGIYAGLS